MKNNTEHFDGIKPFDINEALKLSGMIELCKERTGSYPKRILADKIYRNRENLAYCAERKIRLSGSALDRPKKDEMRNKKQDYIYESDPVDVIKFFKREQTYLK